MPPRRHLTAALPAPSRFCLNLSSWPAACWPVLILPYALVLEPYTWTSITHRFQCNENTLPQSQFTTKGPPHENLADAPVPSDPYINKQIHVGFEFCPNTLQLRPSTHQASAHSLTHSNSALPHPLILSLSLPNYPPTDLLFEISFCSKTGVSCRGSVCKNSGASNLG